MCVKNLFYYISDFFTNYLEKEAGLSINTIRSYRDTFVLLINFMETKQCTSTKRLDIDNLSQECILSFLEWLETERNCGISTRNQRLAAIKAFCRYLIRKDPVYGSFCQAILNIRVKKAAQAQIAYLTTDAIALLVKQPNIKSRHGARDTAMLSLLYETGCRVQELINLRIGDVVFKIPATVTLHGKGRKVRVVPISQSVASIVKAYLKNERSEDPDQALFVNRNCEPLSRSGVSYILDKYAQTASRERPEFYPPKLHPHLLRHSKAMHLLECGVNLIYIRDFLGHSSVTTTEIYAKCNPELKRKYIELASTAIDCEVDRYDESEKDTLLTWLRENI